MSSRQKVVRYELGPGFHKYTAVLSSGKRVYFGDRRYEHYKDSVPKSLGGGRWSHLDHRDPERRRRYRARHAGVKTKNGRAAYKIQFTPAWFSYYYLW